jgi:RNA polymerase sigma-70 factor (ECF subfamily)
MMAWMGRDMTKPDVTRDDPLAALAARARAGDMRALESLLTELLPRLRNLVRYLVRRDSEVDDVAQTALLAVMRGLHTFEARGTFTAWADRVVARVTFNAIRERRDWPPPVGAELESVPASEGAPDYLARRWLVHLLDALPAEQRVAMVLHHVVELTVPEISAELGVPGETVRSRLRLARARLRAMGARVQNQDEEHDEDRDGDEGEDKEDDSRG